MGTSTIKITGLLIKITKERAEEVKTYSTKAIILHTIIIGIATMGIIIVTIKMCRSPLKAMDITVETVPVTTRTRPQTSVRQLQSSTITSTTTTRLLRLRLSQAQSNEISNTRVTPIATNTSRIYLLVTYHSLSL
jgi:hypothetical protein